MSKIDSLAKAGCEIAMRAAAKYVQENKLAPDLEQLVSALKQHINDALPVALQDAREALECRMDAIAERTFAASMVVAGIKAAKEVTAS